MLWIAKELHDIKSAVFRFEQVCLCTAAHLANHARGPDRHQKKVWQARLINLKRQSLPKEATMDIQRKGVGRKRAIRGALFGAIAVAARGGSYGCNRQIKTRRAFHGAFHHSSRYGAARAHGAAGARLGHAVCLRGYPQHVLRQIRPGAPVSRDTVILELDSPDLKLATLNAEYE